MSTAAITRLREKLRGRGVLMRIDLVCVQYATNLGDVFGMSTKREAVIARKRIISVLYGGGFSVVEIADLLCVETYDVETIMRPPAQASTPRLRLVPKIEAALLQTRAHVAAMAIAGKGRPS